MKPSALLFLVVMAVGCHAAPAIVPPSQAFKAARTSGLFPFGPDAIALSDVSEFIPPQRIGKRASVPGSEDPRWRIANPPKGTGSGQVSTGNEATVELVDPFGPNAPRKAKLRAGQLTGGGEASPPAPAPTQGQDREPPHSGGSGAPSDDSYFDARRKVTKLASGQTRGTDASGSEGSNTGTKRTANGSPELGGGQSAPRAVDPGAVALHPKSEGLRVEVPQVPSTGGNRLGTFLSGIGGKFSGLRSKVGALGDLLSGQSFRGLGAAEVLAEA